mgnify:CR=1
CNYLKKKMNYTIVCLRDFYLPYVVVLKTVINFQPFVKKVQIIVVGKMNSFFLF